MKLVIIGGVAGGASAAARARRLSEDAEIILVERGSTPSFANCGLPYYIGGQIAERSKLLVTPVRRLHERYRLDVRTRSSVESIDRTARKIVIRNLDNGTTYEETYDKLILSPGAAPLRPPIPGSDLPGIYTLRDLADADALQEIATSGVQRAVLVGAGFIGLEMAENLVRRGIETTVIELADQVLPPWDPEMTTPIAKHLVSQGVRLVLNDSAAAFEVADDGLVVRLSSGETVATDFVVLSVGVRPENTLAVDASLDVGPRGGIRVNQQMQTSDPNIYAVGDAVEVTDFVGGQPAQIPLAGPANRQGRIAADHAFGREAAYRGTQGTAIVGVFDWTAAMTGLSEKSLRRSGQTYQKIYIHPAHHAGYYPGAERMTLKLLFHPETGRVLGAQAVGGAGVDKRIDVLAVAIQAGMTVFDLEEMELAYAPQFGSAKDPVNMAGFVAAGVLRGDHPIAHVEELPETLTGSERLIDVRTHDEFTKGHIPDAINVPLDELRGHLDELRHYDRVTVYCQVGQRGYMATRILLQSGISARNLSGGYTTYLHHA